MATSLGPALPPQKAIKCTSAGEVRSPPAGGLWQRMSQQMCWDRGGELEGVRGRKGGLPPALMLEKWSQFENFWMHVPPPTLRKDTFAKSAELCPYWQAGEAQLPLLGELPEGDRKARCASDFKCTLSCWQSGMSPSPLHPAGPSTGPSTLLEVCGPCLPLL